MGRSAKSRIYISVLVLQGVTGPPAPRSVVSPLRLLSFDNPFRYECCCIKFAPALT